MCTCVCCKIVLKFIFRGITVTTAIFNETIVTFIGFEPFSVKKTTTIFLNHRKNISMRIKLPLSSVTKSFNFYIIKQL